MVHEARLDTPREAGKPVSRIQKKRVLRSETVVMPVIKVHFSDFFGVTREELTEYGAFNVSLLNDLPLFVDPFLLFNSSKVEYQKLHDDIIRYLRFLRDRSTGGPIRRGLIQAWFTFPEVKQNWLGYSYSGNEGRGLGAKFAHALHGNLNSIFSSFGNETVTRSSHLEKLCLIESGVGKDSISDFTTNLIKGYLLRYTETFAKASIPSSMVRQVVVPKVHFNYKTQSWENACFALPFYDGDYVVLTPRDILTKDDTWISNSDLTGQYHLIANALPNEALRDEINNYFLSVLPRRATAKEEKEIIRRVIRKFPELIEYYIKSKEDSGDEAEAISDLKVAESDSLFVEEVSNLVNLLQSMTGFYDRPGDTYAEARERAIFLKDVIENKGGHRIFYPGGELIRNENDVQILYRLTWCGTPSDISREVDDGRGSADFKASRGSQDKTIIEFKLASNSHLRRNLERQVEIYQRASDADSGLKVITYFSQNELRKVNSILNELGLQGDERIILIDARSDNKPSASAA